MQKRRPNVLWLMTDEQRTDSLGCYGSPWAVSPVIDRIAHEGVLFRNAVTPAPVCAPARTSLAAGQYPHETGIWYNRVDTPDLPLSYLLQTFKDNGYSTASFGKQHESVVPEQQLFDTVYDGVLGDKVSYFGYAEPFSEEEYGVVKYPPEPYPWILGGTYPGPLESKVEAEVVRGAIGWLEEQSHEQPWLLRVSFNAPHTPVVPPQPFDKLMSDREIRYSVDDEIALVSAPAWISDSLAAFSDAARLTDEQISQARRYYYGETAYVDYQFGVLLEWLEERGYLDNTIVVFLSDHGTHIGDYGLVQKQTFYDSVVQVPFLFWHPSTIASGIQLETPVETLSLLPTLLDLAGIAIPAACSGVSLANSLRSGTEPAARPVFSEFTLGSFGVRQDDRLVMVRDGDWKLTLCLDAEHGDGALYDMQHDPWELHSLFNSPEHAAIVSRLTDLIHGHLAN